MGLQLKSGSWLLGAADQPPPPVCASSQPDPLITVFAKSVCIYAGVPLPFPSFAAECRELHSRALDCAEMLWGRRGLPCRLPCCCRLVLLLAVLAAQQVASSGGSGCTPDSSLHGEHHPAVTLHNGELVYSEARRGWLLLQIRIRGLVPGFAYTVVLEALADGTEGRYYPGKGEPIQRWELPWPPPADGAAMLAGPGGETVNISISPGEAATMLWRDAAYRTAAIRLRVYLLDAHPGLTQDDSVLASRALRFLHPLGGGSRRPTWQGEELPDYNSRLSSLRKHNSSWVMNESAWRAHLAHSYREVAIAAMMANVPSLSHHLAAATGARPKALAEGKADSALDRNLLADIPVVVVPGDLSANKVSVPSYVLAESICYTRQMLAEAGFANISVAHTAAGVHTSEGVRGLVEQGVLAASFSSRIRRPLSPGLRPSGAAPPHFAPASEWAGGKGAALSDFELVSSSSAITHIERIRSSPRSHAPSLLPTSLLTSRGSRARTL